MPDPYADSSDAIRNRVATIVGLRESQDELADRITKRDHDIHTGGAAFIVRMESIMRNTNVSRVVEAAIVEKQGKERRRGKRRRR